MFCGSRFGSRLGHRRYVGLLAADFFTVPYALIKSLFGVRLAYADRADVVRPGTFRGRLYSDRLRGDLGAEPRRRFRRCRRRSRGEPWRPVRG